MMIQNPAFCSALESHLVLAVSNSLKFLEDSLSYLVSYCPAEPNPEPGSGSLLNWIERGTLYLRRPVAFDQLHHYWRDLFFS